MGTGSLLGVKLSGLGKSTAIPLLSPLAFVACSRVNCTFTFTTPQSGKPHVHPKAKLTISSVAVFSHWTHMLPSGRVTFGVTLIKTEIRNNVSAIYQFWVQYSFTGYQRWLVWPMTLAWPLASTGALTGERNISLMVCCECTQNVNQSLEVVRWQS